MNKPKLLIFASGTPESGGSGFENLVLASRNGTLDADIVGVVSNHGNGGVRKRADKHGVRFIEFPKPWSGAEYQRIAEESNADFFALSGWLKLVTGLDPDTKFNSKTVFNIHPGPLPEFGGTGLYGHHVHEAVLKAARENKVTHSAVSMHFVTSEYDLGPVFFQCHVNITDQDTAETLAQRVNRAEHRFQPEITNLVVKGIVSWDGMSPETLSCRLMRAYRES